MLASKIPAINYGVGIGYPLMFASRVILGIDVEGDYRLSKKPWNWSLVTLVPWSIGFVLYVWGCASYVAAKGRNGWWTVACLLDLIGMIFLILLTDKHRVDQPDPQSLEPSSTDNN